MNREPRTRDGVQPQGARSGRTADVSEDTSRSAPSVQRSGWAADRVRRPRAHEWTGLMVPDLELRHRALRGAFVARADCDATRTRLDEQLVRERKHDSFLDQLERLHFVESERADALDAGLHDGLRSRSPGCEAD